MRLQAAHEATGIRSESAQVGCPGALQGHAEVRHSYTRLAICPNGRQLLVRNDLHARVSGNNDAVLAPLVMVRAFPAAVRFTGVSFSYHLSYAVFGGVTPLLVSWISHLHRLGPAYYVAAVTILGLLAILTAPTTCPANEG
jgi:hypothetical protein